MCPIHVLEMVFEYRNAFDISGTSTESEHSLMKELNFAYKEACLHGSKENYRIHLALIGHSEAGKTTFIDRLLGKEFQEQRKSTEGIHTHFITSFFNKNNLRSRAWTQRLLEASILEKDFHENVLSQRTFTEPKMVQHQKKRPEESTAFTEPKMVNHQKKRLEESALFFAATFEDDNKYSDTKYAEAFNTGKDFASPIMKRMISDPLTDLAATENEYDDLHENTCSLPSKIGTRTIPTMSSEAFSKLLESKKKYTGPPSDDRIPYSINIWDHGGQSEFILTNHLFLNVQAFILMAMDISLDLNKPLKQSVDAKGKFGIPKTPAQILCYWLNALHVLALEKTTEPNIALVLTHKDMIKADDTKKYIESYIEELLQMHSMENHMHPTSRNEKIFVVDNREGTEGDFAHIKE